MKRLLTKLFLVHWQRKAVSAVLSVVIWFVVNHSLTATRHISNIPVRMINIPNGKTIEGLQSNGLLSKRITLALMGNKNLLNELTANDLEVVIDASDKHEEWIASITKKNLVPLNPELDLSKGISRVSHQSFIIRLTKLVTEKIPVLITQPIGEPPRDYQFLDVWPYKLNLMVGGPEEMIKQLKAKGLKLTFNLNDISKAQLDALSANMNASNNDVVSFYVPDQWKQINLPILSDAPLEVNDPQAKALRIDFVRCNLLPLEKPIPISFYVPPEFAFTIKPTHLKIAASSFIKESENMHCTSPSLCAKGVSSNFLKIVRDMLQIVVIVVPKSESATLEWSLQFINPRVLEDRYVSLLMSDASDDEIRDLQPVLREEYLRNRFRSYMNRFQLFWPDDTRVDLKIELQDNVVLVKEK